MIPPRLPTRICGLLPGLGTLLALAASAEAGSRRFTYSYETTAMAKDALELESSVTWKTSGQSNRDFDIRHEFEYGVSDRLQVALYFADWSYQKSDGKSGRARFDDIAVEAIYTLTDPNTSPFGSAVYGELRGGGDFIELEGKLLLQKNIGQWMFVYNAGGEFALQDDFRNDEAELMQSAGVSYQINPNWSAGAELLHEIAVPGADTIGDSGVYVGPNFAWRKERFAVTVTGLWQLTSVSGEPDFQLRTIFSIAF